MTQERFGAGHVFGRKKPDIGKEIRIGRTVYIKASHLQKVMEYAEVQNLNISQSFDHFLQCGIAYDVLMMEQAQMKLRQFTQPQEKP